MYADHHPAPYLNVQSEPVAKDLLKILKCQTSTTGLRLSGVFSSSRKRRGKKVGKHWKCMLFWQEFRSRSHPHILSVHFLTSRCQPTSLERVSVYSRGPVGHFQTITNTHLKLITLAPVFLFTRAQVQLGLLNWSCLSLQSCWLSNCGWLSHSWVSDRNQLITNLFAPLFFL